MEGNSIRATARLNGVSKATILKLLEDAGRQAIWYQNRVHDAHAMALHFSIIISSASIRR